MRTLIQVRYRNNREGLVDDVTLNELISSNKIRQFYRPSESRWVDVDRDSVRTRSNGYGGPERRGENRRVKNSKPAGWLSRILGRKRKKKSLSAEEWFEQGFSLMHMTSDYRNAALAFTSAIELDPAYARAYLNRGMAHERMNDTQQAVADYGRAIELIPKDAKAYYIRGLLFHRLGKDLEAADDMKASAELGYRPARDFLKHNLMSYGLIQGED